ncbi:MAG: ethanolamine utilization protein EutN [Planctomycetota bacterium]|nr:MAG: ethanolamine utilization protein EutN [Planctomycetota bacterium]
MILGRVIGTVWATRKERRLEGLKFLIVQHLDLKGKPLPSFDVAVDAVEAGVGERVLIAKGSSARQSDITDKKPVDAIIMAIVEGLEFYAIDELVKEYEKREKEFLEAAGEF